MSPRTYRAADRAAQLELEADEPQAGPYGVDGDDYDEQHDTPPPWLAGPFPELVVEPDAGEGLWRVVSNGVEVVSGCTDELEARRARDEFEQAVREVRCGW